MEFLLNRSHPSLERVQESWRRYEAYLKANRYGFPADVLAYLDSGLWNSGEPHAPHDAGVKEVLVHYTEPPWPTVNRRTAEITVKLYGSYNDHLLQFHYTSVREFELRQPVGCWHCDETRLNDDDEVVHEIAFDWGDSWLITCDSFFYSCEKTSSKND